jgi:putative spermidine/putrescine transport system ATP-binding protein
MRQPILSDVVQGLAPHSGLTLLRSGAGPDDTRPSFPDGPHGLAVGERASTGMTNAQPHAICVRAACKRFGTSVVLDDVSLDVADGEFVTLLGPSGSGKTTLLNIIAGFTAPDAGSVHFGAEDVTRVPPHKRGIGIVFQNYALFPHMSVADNVAFPLKARGVAGGEIADQVAWALSLVKLDGYGGRRIDQLSGGQRQRVALARAIVFRPKLILMDEPLSALDKQLREHMQIEIRTLHERLGATTIYVTHDQREALTMSNRIAVLNKGRIAQFAAPETVYNYPADAFVADFIGEAALVPVERVDESSVRLEGTVLRCAQPVPQGDKLALVVRSEKLRLARDGEDENAFPVTVRSRMFQGESQLMVVEIGGGLSLTFRLPTHVDTDGSLPQPGQQAKLSLHPEHAFVVPAGQAP